MVKVFKNPSALDESIENIELSGQQESEVKRLKDKIRYWIEAGDSKIIAYIGSFGSGKSATLAKVEKSFNDKRLKTAPSWVNFEAWRYADRTKLWEGFVLQVSGELEKKNKGKVRDTIDGYRSFNKFVYTYVVPLTIVVFIIWLLSSFVIWEYLNGQDGGGALFIKSFLKYAFPSLLALLAIIGASFFLRPITRAEELEVLFEKALKKLKTPLVVVAEDIDRAGDEGAVFLETLRHFINTHKTTKSIDFPIILIAPQDISYMTSVNDSTSKGLARGVKIYDTAVYYNPNVIRSSAEMDRLLSKADIEQKYMSSVREAVGFVQQRFKEQVSLRLIKFMLRELEEFAELQNDIDPYLALIFISTRYLKFGKANEERTYLTEFVNRFGNDCKFSSTVSDPMQPFLNLLIQHAHIQENVSNTLIQFSLADTEIHGEVTKRNPVGSVHVTLSLNARYLLLVDG